MVAGAGAGRASTHDEERRCNVLTKQEGSSLGPQATPALAKAARAPCSPPGSPPAHRNSRELSWENSQQLSVENSRPLQQPLFTHLSGLTLTRQSQNQDVYSVFVRPGKTVSYNV